jgi:hypothetical protein
MKGYIRSVAEFEHPTFLNKKEEIESLEVEIEDTNKENSEYILELKQKQISLKEEVEILEPEIKKYAKEIYILIGSKNSDASELRFVLYHKSKALRPLTLEDIFGED